MIYDAIIATLIVLLVAVAIVHEYSLDALRQRIEELERYFKSN